MNNLLGIKCYDGEKRLREVVGANWTGNNVPVDVGNNS